MLSISRPLADRLNLELSGALDTAAMQAGLDDLIEQSMDITHGKMLYKVLDFEMPTMGALAVELRQMPKLFGLINKFDKCAVLSDVAWIRTAAEIEGAVIPSFEIKSFPLSATAAAERWLDGQIEEGDREEADENFPV